MLAEIVGYGSTCEAFHRVRLQECGEEPARAIGLAMQEAGVGPQDIHYVNLHGTSTDLNDRIETRALKLALGEERAHQVPMSAPEVADRTSARRVRSRGSCRYHHRHADRADSSDASTSTAPTPCAISTTSRNRDDARRSSTRSCNCIAFGSKNSALVLRRASLNCCTAYLRLRRCWCVTPENQHFRWLLCGSKLV